MKLDLWLRMLCLPVRGRKKVRVCAWSREFLLGMREDDQLVWLSQPGMGVDRLSTRTSPVLPFGDDGALGKLDWGRWWSGLSGPRVSSRRPRVTLRNL